MSEAGIEAENKALIAEFMEVFSTGDFEAALAMFDDAATWWVAGSLPGISGSWPIQEYGKMASAFARECEGQRIPLTPSSFIAEGDLVAVEAKTHVGVQNGRVYDNEYHFVFEVRDGKIQAVREYLDSDHARSVFLDP